MKTLAEKTGKYLDIAVCLLLVSWTYFAVAGELWR